METKRTLIIAHKPPYPKVDGGCIAIAQMLETLLDEGHQITFLSIETNKHPAANEIAHKNLTYKTVLLNTRVQFLQAVANFCSNSSYILSRFNQDKFRKALETILIENEFDHVVFESLFSTPYINSVQKLSTAKRIYRSHNIEHQIWETQSNNSSNFLLQYYLKIQSQRLKKEEFKIWNSINSIASISSKDTCYIQKHCSSTVKTVSLYPSKKLLNYIDTSTKVDFFHIGAMDWLPNINAINWLIENVWEKVMHEQPNAQLHLAGRAMPKSLLNLTTKGIQNHGEVDDAIKFMAAHKIMLVPLFSGSGIRIKIMEGMALGKCIICTSLAAQGIPIRDKENIFIANSTSEFINRIVYCLKNPDVVHQIGLNAKKFVAKNFTKTEVMNQMNTLL